ncbi:ATP-binding cassette domain-containing protein [Devosia sp.]|uniref:ATP-binding cassette domain-containing protein n=1 Tax=Devosia sp. TaxID=1871048 RepID=UPI003A907183
MPLFDLTRPARDGETLRLTLEPLGRLAVVGIGPAERKMLALAAAGLLPEGETFDGALLLAGTAYPVGEKPLAKWRGRRIGYLGPPKPVPGDGTVDFHIRLLLGAKVDADELRQRAGLTPEDGRRPLSGLTRAQQQRLRLAIVLWPAPELVVARDPVTGLDPWESAGLFDRLKAAGCAVLMFTDDAEAARSLDGEIAIVDGGRVIERGPQQKMTDAGQQEVTRHLLVPEKRRSWTMARPPIGGDLLEGRGIETEAFPGRAVDLTVRRGETVGVLGEAGAGKRALLRVIARLDRPRAGTIRLDRITYSGADPAAPARTGIAFIGRDPHLAFNPQLSVGLTLTEPLRVEQQLLVEEQAERLAEAVRAVGLNPDQLDRHPDRFSPADLQRLALARALIARPILLVLDEPTARLPPEARTNFLLLVQRVRADFGLSVLIASRSFDALRDMSDRIVVLADGAVVETGKPGDLIESAREEITRRLLGYPRPVPPESEPEPEGEREPEPEVEPEAAVSTVAVPAEEPETLPASEPENPPVAPSQPVTVPLVQPQPAPMNAVIVEVTAAPTAAFTIDTAAPVAPVVSEVEIVSAEDEPGAGAVADAVAAPVPVAPEPAEPVVDEAQPVVPPPDEVEAEATLPDSAAVPDEHSERDADELTQQGEAAPEAADRAEFVGPPAPEAPESPEEEAEPDPPRERGRPEP